ncbi:Protein of unknown function DUF4249 [Flavobacteriaceae bacterium]
MKPFQLNIFFLQLILCLTLISCTEQYALQTNTFENALVVEATITNELKKQEIKITRTYRLEEEETTIESGALVTVTDTENNKYVFDQKDSVYVSQTEFNAIPGRKYRLDIITSQGKVYYSTPQTLTTINEIQNIDVRVETRKGDRGVEINVNSYDPTGTSKYYRYEYEETYKIMAPQWDARMTKLLPLAPDETHPAIIVLPRTQETKTCYTTKKEDNIIQTSTNQFLEDRVHFPIRFISNQNYIISHRYSILVRQYIQTIEAYSFYKTLKEISGNESILSQTQPGFFYGNIKSSDNPNEKVIGFFEVSSVSSKRIFFNYADLFPKEPLPPYFIDCTERLYVDCFNPTPECKGAALRSAISGNLLVHLGSSNITYLMVPPPCGDCTSFSSNVTPSFWID